MSNSSSASIASVTLIRKRPRGLSLKPEGKIGSLLAMVRSPSLFLSSRNAKANTWSAANIAGSLFPRQCRFNHPSVGQLCRDPLIVFRSGAGTRRAGNRPDRFGNVATPPLSAGVIMARSVRACVRACIYRNEMGWIEGIRSPHNGRRCS